ncbi:gamma-glutamyltransferase family protein [Desulforhabdus amnigena]|jgi:gamma-glutamyltranspeptidase/glutathione hydrolase|uniref:Gamma-glutamyltranspeptidase n=1 Tax=Desulforhabdus amnigena TaxID=40218 RepID=A0A9W6FWQ2_9BACT|nr:gamma-glutamyltransferase family protein [Desulforhabdus amnigena]GLI36306.1 gamma-glutamyltranspeptidase [Desulforhabdus amnigena]
MRSFGKNGSQNRPFTGNVQGFRAAIATEHFLSAQAGMDILKQGGNAFDAAAAATLVESVVNPHMFTLGGECPMVLYVADRQKVVSVNGNTQAPQKATIEAYQARGLELIPPDGVLAAGVPAALSALVEMLVHYGSLPFETVAEPAFLMARDGFPAHEGLVGMPRFSLEANREKFLEHYPNTAAVYLNADGSVPHPGQKISNAPLARFLSILMEEARRAAGGGREAGLRAVKEAFYLGDMAREVERFVQERDGYLNMQDLAAFETFLEEPASTRFRDAIVFKCGPWSQGPVFLQLLNLLDGFDLEGFGHNSTDYLHLWTEAAKLAYADREQYYADPRFVDVPLKELLSREYNAKRRKLIDMERASALHRPGDPRRGDSLLSREEVFQRGNWGFGTVHIAVADSRGNLAALTPSGGWISANEVIPALGFPLTSRLQTFYLEPRHPNVIAPGKRPRTTLSPSLAFYRGHPWMAFGTMGGDQQDQWTSQFFLNRLVFRMSVQEAIEAPKITCDHIPGSFYPHDAFPKSISLEGRIAPGVAEELKRRGHVIKRGDDWSAGYICAVSRDEEGLLQAGADPRGQKGSVFPACALAW